MNKLTDTEIVKALECCCVSECDECPYDEQTACVEILKEGALALINRQKAEIENNAQFTMQYSQLELLREKCIEHQDFHKGDDGVFRAYVSIEDLDQVIDELEVRS